MARAIGTNGGTLLSANGRFTVILAEGSLPNLAEISVAEITNRAPRGVGSAYRIGPPGTKLARPATLQFTASPDEPDFEALSVAYQRASGFWFRVEGATRDAASRTISVTTNHFSDWSLIRGYEDDPHDLFGAFHLDQQIELGFTATGFATLYFDTSDASGAYYLVTGTITVPDPFPIGSRTCTPDTATKELPDSIAETIGNPLRFRWGINGHWTLNCTDPGGNPSQEMLVTSFDSLGINLLRYSCSRNYVGAQTNDLDNVVGAQTLDCGANGTVAADWDFHSCTVLGEGTACGGGRTCQGGYCKP